MKTIAISIILITFSFFLSAQSQGSLVINEFLASNNNNITDNFGEHEDWIEIYNPGNMAVNIATAFFISTSPHRIFSSPT